MFCHLEADLARGPGYSSIDEPIAHHPGPPGKCEGQLAYTKACPPHAMELPAAPSAFPRWGRRMGRPT